MPVKTGFDSERYLKEQAAAILERVKMFNNKLYLEFGGKLLFDYHASRVLPGFDPNIKMRLLQQLKDRAEILLCIYSGESFSLTITLQESFLVLTRISRCVFFNSSRIEQRSFSAYTRATSRERK